MKKLFIVLISAMLLLSLCSCAKPKDEPITDEPLGTVDAPDESLPVSTDDPSVTTEPDIPEDTTSPTSEEPLPEDTTSTSEDEEAEVVAVEIDLNCRAGDTLELLNSDKVHTRFTEAVSVDGENVYGGIIEYFVDGDKMVFIDNDTRIIIDGDRQIICDGADQTYIVAEYDAQHAERIFGYDLSAYTFLYEEEEEDCHVEYLTVEQYGNMLTSTWRFYDDGTIAVSEGSEDAGAFTAYHIDFIDTDLSGMDMNIPEGYEEIQEY